METNTQARMNQRQNAATADGAAAGRRADARPPEKMLNSPAIEVMEMGLEPEHVGDLQDVEEKVVKLSLMTEPGKQPKQRKAPRKWSDGETRDLLLGVEKYGSGKWKLILEDAAYSFNDRTTVDLKDRYRVCVSGSNKSRHGIESGEPLAPSSPSIINTLVSSESAKDVEPPPKPPSLSDKASSTNPTTG